MSRLRKSNGKNPGFFMYGMDFMRDMAPHPPEIRGVWISVMCTVCFSKTPGSATMTLQQWSRIFGTSIEKTLDNLAYLKMYEIGDISTFKGEENEAINITSRRMVRDHQLSQIRRKCGKLGGKTKNDLLKQNSSKSEAKAVANIKQNTEIEKEYISVNKEKEKRGVGRKEKTHSDHKKIMTLYHETFKAKFETAPNIDGGKDGAIIRKLLQTIPYEDLAVLMYRFFDSEDEFILKSGYTIGVFKSQINKLKIDKKQSNPKSFGPEKLWMKMQEAKDEATRPKEIPYSDNQNKGNPTGSPIN